MLVHPDPTMEGRNELDLRDINGKSIIRGLIGAAMKDGRAWIDLYWYKPGQNTSARKQTFVWKTQLGQETVIVGSGLYLEE
jgi:signal transduction histidine kinase